MKKGDKVLFQFHLAGVTSEAKVKVTKVTSTFFETEERGENDRPYRFDLVTGECLNDDTSFGARRSVKLDNEKPPTPEQIKEWKEKAMKWDNLGDGISKCYCNSNGEYDEENPEIEGADLVTIGEMAANAYGWF